MILFSNEINAPKLDEKDIADWELRLGFSMPDGWRKFLLEYNGGQPTPNAFCFNSGDETRVELFFSLGVGRKYNYADFLFYFELYKNRLPDGMLPIAIDPGGSLVLIHSKDSLLGKVYFWDHELESEDGDEPAMDNIYWMADSLEDFLLSLH